jgi:hypothetical protein
MLIILITLSSLAVFTLSNPYKDNSEVLHSLYRERDDPLRLSNAITGVPEQIPLYLFI